MQLSCQKCTTWFICLDLFDSKLTFFIMYCFDYVHRYGPLKHHWTMRYESKHSYFKQIANSLGNYINICHTLAMRHEQLHCYYRLDDSVFAVNMEVGPGIGSYACYVVKFSILINIQVRLCHNQAISLLEETEGHSCKHTLYTCPQQFWLAMHSP